MNMHYFGLAATLAAALVPRIASAQVAAQQPAAPQAAAEAMQCARVQPVVSNIIAAAMGRLETARQSNNPAEMRAALDHLAAALRDIRTQLAPCSAAAAATEPHAGHAAAPAKSAPARPAAASDPHAGHPITGKAGGDVKSGKVMDPVTGLMVDPATAPQTTYQGQTYYFSSEPSRQEFLANPAKFAKKPKG